jgi:uncharacterized alpha-E superfamily protein
LLRSSGAWETFLRTYRGALDDRHAAEFLLLDRLFPRSVFAALSAAEGCLADLEPDPGRAGVATDAQRIVGRARTGLEFRGADELINDLGTPATGRPALIHALTDRAMILTAGHRYLDALNDYQEALALHPAT